MARKATPTSAASPPTTVAQWRRAVERLNVIANEKAQENGLCPLWDEIIEEVAAETGLPLKPRERQTEVTLDRVTFVLDGVVERDDGETFLHDALAKAGAKDIQSDYVSVFTTTEEV